MQPRLIAIPALAFVLFAGIPGTPSAGAGALDGVEYWVDQTVILLELNSPKGFDLLIHIDEYTHTSDVAFRWQIRLLDAEAVEFWQFIRGIQGFPIAHVHHGDIDVSAGYEIWPTLFMPYDYEETVTMPEGRSYFLLTAYNMKVRLRLSWMDNVSVQLIAEDPLMHRLRFHNVQGDWTDATFVAIAGTGIAIARTQEVIRYPNNLQLIAVDGAPGWLQVSTPDGQECESIAAGALFATYVGWGEPAGEYKAYAVSGGHPNLTRHRVMWEIIDLPIGDHGVFFRTC